LSFSLFLFDIYEDEEGPVIRWSITQVDLLNDFPNLCTFSQKKKNIMQRNFRNRNQKTAKSRSVDKNNKVLEGCVLISRLWNFTYFIIKIKRVYLEYLKSIGESFLIFWVQINS